MHLDSFLLTGFSVSCNSLSTLEFSLTETKNISISIFDIMGKEVKNISVRKFNAGENKITIDLSNLQDGIYFCILQSNQNIQATKLIKH